MVAGRIESINLAEMALRIRELKAAERYEDRLIDFCDYVWPVVEPAIPFVKGWAIEAVADHLQAVTEGDIRKLLINVPPGFTKSLMTDVFWPAWEWGPRNLPHYRYVCFSYTSHITERDNMRCRNIVMSDRYQRVWGKRVIVSNEQFTKVKFANIQTGWKLATSVTGIGVGERGDRIIIDDPNNTQEVESEAIRANTELWFTEVIPSRLNNPKESAIVIIMQRLHERDVSGIALARNMGYTHLRIPMEYEPRLYINGWTPEGIKTFEYGLAAEFLGKYPEKIFWEDPRIKDGELAWPERFPPEETKQLKNDYTEVGWAGQYQQSPAPRGGSIIKRDFWQPWTQEQYPPLEYILASLDTAYTEKEANDFSGMTVWGVFRGESETLVDRMGNIIEQPGNPKVILLYAWRERLQFHELITRVVDTCTLAPGTKSDIALARFPADRLLIESRSAGISVAQEISRIAGFSGKFSIELVNPKNMDKVARAHSIEAMFEHGMVHAPDRPFAYMVMDEAAVFPNGATDDLTDSLTMALRWLRDQNFALRKEEFSEQMANRLAFRPGRSKALYPC